MNLYIGNLSLDTTEAELREEFGKYGEVISVTIMNDRYIGSGQPRGYGYIQMVSKERRDIAISHLEGITLNHRLINVVEALPVTKHGEKTPAAPGTKRFYKKRERRAAADFRTSGY